MRAVLIPVKDFSKAKQRLAADLPSAGRAGLARAMLEDVFATVAAVRGIDAVFVVSSEPLALERARTFGWATVQESRQLSESDSVDCASRFCAERGVRALLRLPIDIPLVEPRDIEALFETIESPPATLLVPSRDGTGTNALLRTPPALFPSHFGPGSFARHLSEAARCGARAQVLRNPRVELDVDDLEDLRILSRCSRRDTATHSWLAAHGIEYGLTLPEGGTLPARSVSRAAGRGSAGP